MSKYKSESFYRAQLRESLLASAGVANLKVTSLPKKLPTTTAPLMVTVSPNTENEEIFVVTGYDAVTLTLTVAYRGINPSSDTLTTAGVDYNVTANYKDHSVGDLVRADINNIHINQAISSNESILVTGQVYGPVYATTAARDAAITSPVNGMTCYVTADGVFYDYQGGAWVDRATGATPNASETVAGKVEQSTLAEQGAGTETGTTGAPLFVSPKNTAKTSSGASDENKIPKLDANGSINAFIKPDSLTLKDPLSASDEIIIADSADGYANKKATLSGIREAIPASTSAKGTVEMATDGEATTGTDQERYINPKQAKDNYLMVVDTLRIQRTASDASSTVQYSHGLGKVPKMIKFTPLYAGNGNGLLSFGTYVSGKNYCVYANGASSNSDITKSIYLPGIVEGVVSATSTTTFDITWTKLGGTLTIDVLVDLYA